jgi:hypothetical protein
MSALLRKYGVATTIYFPLIKAGSPNFAVSADFTHAAGDTKISKDGGAAANPTNSPAAITMGNGAMWKLDLTATEMQAKSIAITVIDATTKAVEDQMILIETYGAANGEMDVNDFADGLLKRDWTSVTGEAARSVLNALRVLRNKWSISGSTMTVTKEDDTTTAFTSVLTTAAGTDRVTGGDPT